MVTLPAFFFSSRRRHTRYWRDWSSDVCSSDLAERVGETRETGGNARSRIDSRVAVTVVVIGGTLVGVGQNLVRLFCLLEQLLRLGVIRIAIRMMLHGEATKCFLDGLLVGVVVDAQHLVAVTLCHFQADSLRP